MPVAAVGAAFAVPIVFTVIGAVGPVAGAVGTIAGIKSLQIGGGAMTAVGAAA